MSDVNKNLENLARVFGADRLVSSSDIEQVLKGISAVLASYKSGTEKMNEETKVVVNQLLEEVVDRHEAILDQVKKDTSKTKEQVEQELKACTEKIGQEVKALIEEVRSSMPQDGKDADEAAIIESVLAKIKLPENKEFILEGESIVEQVNSLATDNDDLKIDASHIKNLPVSRGAVVGGTRFLAKLADVAVDNQTLANNHVLKWNSTSNRWENGAGGGGGGSGDVVGPATATDNAVARFDGATGELLQNSTVIIGDTGNITGVGTLSSGAITSTGASSLGSLTLSTDLAVADGGTGASTAANARTNLGLAIGTDVQAFDSDLSAIAGLSSTGLISRTGSGSAATRTITAGTGIGVTNGDGASGNPTIALSTNALTEMHGITIDGGGSAITTGVKGYLYFPYSCTITSWAILADQVGSIVIDVWKDSYANFPPLVADSIAGSEKPTLSSAQKNVDVALSTWTTSIIAGEILAFNVDSATTVTRVTLTLSVTKT
jgi:hypothetical protein